MLDLDLIKIGRFAFLVGILLSILPVFIPINSLSIVLYFLGLIIGILHVTDEESTLFLIALIALLVIGISNIQLGSFTSTVIIILNNFIALLSAAGLVVALKQIFGVVKD